MPLTWLLVELPGSFGVAGPALLGLVNFPCLSGRATWQCGNGNLLLHNGLPGKGQVLSPFYTDGESQPEEGHMMGSRASLDLDASTLCKLAVLHLCVKLLG